MSRVLRAIFPAAIAMAGLFGAQAARGAFVVGGGFGPYGDLGFATSPPALGITYGADGQGSIFQMDGLVNVSGANYGSQFGKSADLGSGSPAGLAFTFSASQPTADQLLLSYRFVNNTGAALAGFQFLYYVDPDVGSDFPYEYATVNGLAGLGKGSNPTSFQVSDAYYGSLFTTLGAGQLTNVNEIPANQPGDVAFGLGFAVGTLGAGQSASFQVLLSDDGSHLGGFSITERDPNNPGDTLTVSGIVVPEPSSLALVAAGLASVSASLAWRRRGARSRAQAWTRSQ